jgi:hypothetical protein
MADIEKSVDEGGKKPGRKLFSGGGKFPTDAVLLVVVPFVSFMLLFMYAMGLIPPRPPHVQLVDALPVEEKEEAVTEPDERLAPRLPEPTPGQQEPEDVQSRVSSEGTTEAVEVLADEGGEAGGVTSQEVAGFASADTTMTDEERLMRIKQLAKVYEQMNATSVAAIVTAMEDRDAVGILANMKPRNAAKVLASLEPQRAAALSVMLTGSEAGTE